MLVIVDFTSVTIASGVLVNMMTTIDSMRTVNIIGSVGPLASVFAMVASSIGFLFGRVLVAACGFEQPLHSSPKTTAAYRNSL